MDDKVALVGGAEIVLVSSRKRSCFKYFDSILADHGTRKENFKYFLYSFGTWRVLACGVSPKDSFEICGY